MIRHPNGSFRVGSAPYLRPTMFRVLHSSAGAGKTHALVKRYIGLCLASENPAAYRQVLALTFTNKAAAEMRERAIEYLHALTLEGAPDARMRDVIVHMVNEHGVDADLARSRAKQVFPHMLHHWTEVSISTIDALVRKLVKPFAQDLRLDMDLRMSTDVSYYHDRAVDMLVDRTGNEAALTRILVATCEQLVEDDKGWDPKEPFAELVKELSKERSVQHVEELKDLSSDAFIAISEKLWKKIRATEKMVRSIAQRTLDAIAAAGLDPLDFKYGRSGPGKYFVDLKEFTHEVPRFNSNVVKAIENDEWAGPKATADVRSRIQSVVPALRSGFNEMQELFDGNVLTDHVVRRAIFKEIMPLGALHALEEELEHAKDEDGITFFQDLTRRVAEIVREEPVPFLYERMGQRFRHFLIDEFQDTSLMQWHALLPLVEHALGGGGEVLLVGDAKQAIYRWRNGEVRQFISLPDIHDKHAVADGARREESLNRSYVPTEALQHNYRSVPDIVDFNNRLFERCKELLPEKYRTVYEGHQQIAVRKDRGMVHVVIVPADKVKDDTRVVEDEMVVRSIRECLADGFSLADVAVLVRKGDHAKRIAAVLDPEGIACISRDALSMNGDPNVEFIIAVLRFFTSRTDDDAAIALQWLATLRNDASTVQKFLAPEPLRAPTMVLSELLEGVDGSRRGSTLLDRVLGILEHFDITISNDAYLSAFLDRILAHMHEHGHDPRSFIEQWDRGTGPTGVSIPEDADAVKLMTIHTAKGSQFPVVIVPFTEMDTSGGNRESIWIDAKRWVPELDHALIGLNKKVQNCGLEEVDTEVELRELDALNLLYVACTRAEERLYLQAKEISKDKYVAQLRTFWSEVGPDGSFGEQVLKKAKLKETQASTWKTVDARGASSWSLRYTVPEEWDPAAPDPFRKYGEQVHAVFAGIDTIADIDPQIDQLLASGEMSAQAGEELRDKLKTLVSSAALAPFFGLGLTTYREMALIDEQGGALRPDRIVQSGGEWRILDLKTGEPRSSHTDQVRRYTEVLKQVTGSSVSGSLLYMRTGDLVDVR